MTTAPTPTVLTESDDMETRAYAENLRWAWQQWAAYVCEESGGHRWTLYGCDPEEWGNLTGGSVHLECTCCHATGEYLAGWDADELIYGDLGDIRVEHGNHDSAHEFARPVRARVVVEKYGPNLDMITAEYDVSIVVEPA
jgi:hypothetical protein